MFIAVMQENFDWQDLNNVKVYRSIVLLFGGMYIVVLYLLQPLVDCSKVRLGM